MWSLQKTAIFECDDTLDPDKSRHVGYGGLISTWLMSNPRLRDHAQIRVWDTKTAMQNPEPYEYDVILTNGARK